MSGLKCLFIGLLLSYSTAFAGALSSSDIMEGFDRQSPQEIESARKNIEKLFSNSIKPQQVANEDKTKILERYQHLDPNNEVPDKLLEDTILYFDQNKSKFPNQAYISIIDFSVHSSHQRLFVIDVQTGVVEKYRTTHGWASDKNNDGYAESFGNVVNSGKSSLGFVRTAEVYWGKFKRSIRLDGLSSTNSKVRERAIVLHGWDKAYERHEQQGLSWGCPALDWSVKDGIIDKVKEGSLMYFGISN